MDLTLFCACSEEQWTVFDDLDIRGYVEMEDWDKPTIIAHTSAAMVAEVTETLEAHGIAFVVSSRVAEAPECAVECTICKGDLENAQALPCGDVFCQNCIERWLRNHRICPNCNTPVY